jgi:hypothetical protein
MLYLYEAAILLLQKTNKCNEDIKLVARIAPYAKKLLSLAMIFNSLLSIVYAMGLLRGYYINKWALYQPYLVSGTLFWALIPASIADIFPSTLVGKVKTGRLWFHHYVYGFIVLTLAIIFIVLCVPISILDLFTAYTADASVNIGRFFFLGGLALVLDDLTDVSNLLRRGLGFLKLKAYQGKRIMHVIQCLVSLFLLYLFSAVVLSMVTNPAEATLPNLIFAGNLLVASLISIGIIKLKTWLKITVPKD